MMDNLRVAAGIRHTRFQSRAQAGRLALGLMMLSLTSVAQENGKPPVAPLSKDPNIKFENSKSYTEQFVGPVTLITTPSERYWVLTVQGKKYRLRAMSPIRKEKEDIEKAMEATLQAWTAKAGKRQTVMRINGVPGGDPKMGSLILGIFSPEHVVFQEYRP